MKTEDKRVSLTNKEGMGGIIGGKGYKIQDKYIVNQIPYWLKDSTFSQILIEGIEDVDVRYKGDGNDFRIAYQIKDHSISPSEFKEIVRKFKDKDEATPGTYRKIIIAAPILSGKVKSLRDILVRCKDAAPFYNDAPHNIMNNTYDDLDDKIKELKLPVNREFLLEKVAFENIVSDNPKDEIFRHTFVGSILEIEQFNSIQPLALQRAFEKLSSFIVDSVGKTISRDEILNYIYVSVKEFNKSAEKSIVFSIHNWRYELPSLEPDFDLDWTRYFDRNVSPRKVPLYDEWGEIIKEFNNIRDKILSTSEVKLIRFQGRVCLSTGLIFGHAFAENAGFVIEVIQPNQDKPWRTSDKPMSQPCLSIREVKKNGSSDIVVLLNTTGEGAEKQVITFLDSKGIAYSKMIILEPMTGVGGRSVINGGMAISIAEETKKHLREFQNKYNAQLVHLFLVCPIGVSIFIGQKLQSCGRIQCYEYLNPGYAESCTLV